MTAGRLIRFALDVDVRSARDGRAALASPEHIAASIRRGEWPSDVEFDRCMRDDVRAVSPNYWSQLAVAARSARWFEQLGVETVVDIGSGAGKFCVATALASRCRFIGLEQRPHLIAASRALAESFGIQDRVHFQHATFGEDPVPAADVYYFYNPFGEHLFPHAERIDSDVELSGELFVALVAAAEDLLRRAPVGTHLLAYNGFGGRVPSSYRPILLDRRLPCLLRMWRKTTHAEVGDGELACAE